MKPLTCAGVEEQIDLYVADECEAEQKSAIARHLAVCPNCARAAEEARELQGLLSLRLRERDNLQALRSRLEREKVRTRRPMILSLMRRTAAVAAMLLVMVGSLAYLGLWQPRPVRDEGPQVAILWQSDDAEIRRAAPNRLEIVSGQVHLEITPGTAKGSAAMIETPAGVAQAKESRLFVEVAPRTRETPGAPSAAVLVLSGEVNFLNDKGKAAVRPGQVLEAKKNAVPHAEHVDRQMNMEKVQALPASALRRDWGEVYRALKKE
jgi:anti-sigma factor RsiW